MLPSPWNVHEDEVAPRCFPLDHPPGDEAVPRFDPDEARSAEGAGERQNLVGPDIEPMHSTARAFHLNESRGQFGGYLPATRRLRWLDGGGLPVRGR
jgi:hypothetical protein